MNTEPKKNAPAINKELSEALKAAPSHFWNRLSHNWGWKLLSLLLAVCLWAGLITQDPNLTRERRFTDVPITLTGADTLRRNGLIVLSGLEEENLQLESFRAQVPQRSYDSVTVSNYNPRIDLTRISQTGEQDVKVLFTTSSTYGTVEGANPETFHIVVDEYVTNYRIPVQLNLLGDYPEGFYATSPVLEPGTVSVSGPRSLVDQVATVQVDFDPATLTPRAGVSRLAIPLKFMDADGNVIESKLLEAASANTVLRTITMEQRLYESKKMDVSYHAMLTGEPAKGYEVTSMTAEPSSIIAAGDSAVLEAIESIFADDPVSVSGKSESFAAQITLRKPAELAYLSAKTATVYVEIEPAIISRDFTDIHISVKNVPSGLKATLPQRDTTVTVTGPMLLVEAIRANQLQLSVDVSGLEAGEHVLPIEVYLNKNMDQEPLEFAVQHASITVILKD